MAKLPAIWRAGDGSSSITANSGSLLLESSSHLLLENGSKLLLEDTLDTPKQPIIWSSM